MNFGERAEHVRAMPCLTQCGSLITSVFIEDDGTCTENKTRCQGPIQACHTIARGMGGAKGDRRNLVPLCAHHHTEAGERGTSLRKAFEARYGLDLEVEADEIAEQLDSEGVP